MSERADVKLVSVIMPCYNARPFIEEAVQSVLGQTYPEVELVVIDDGSDDGSVDVLRELAAKHPGRVQLLYQSRKGPYPARNLGLQHARGTLIAFLDADDYWRLDFLELMVAALGDSGGELAYCGWQNLGATDRSNEPFVPRDYERGDKIAMLLEGGSPWPIHAALTRRSIIDAIGGFRTDLETSADFDLWLRIASRYPVTLVPEVLAYYRFHDNGQISTRPWLQAINGWRVKRGFLEKSVPDNESVREELLHTVDRTLLRRGYDFYWRRNLAAARHVFRFALRNGLSEGADIKYLLLSLLPAAIYRSLITGADRMRRRL